MRTAVIVGAGHRAMCYAAYARLHPDRLAIAAVAEPNEVRRSIAAQEFGIPRNRCFASAEELAAQGKIADGVINGTMDRQHVSTTIPLLELGYDVLLEKPFATSEAEVHRLEDAVQRTGRHVMICHVLRYADFYLEIKRIILEGHIGDVIDIQTCEHVCYHHYSTSFARGKWRNLEECGSSMLLSKCSHDLDLLTWYKAGIRPARVTSLGGRRYFRKECAPAGSGTQCLVDCPLEKNCLYSARKLYIDHPTRRGSYIWAPLEGGDQSVATKEKLLKDPDFLFGHCVWKCDNDVVDRQTVSVEFADGALATHNMIGGAARALRSIHIIGTKGEIRGCFDDSKFSVYTIETRPGHPEFNECVIDLAARGTSTAGHGGGDMGLAADFVRLLHGEAVTISCTDLAGSVYGHLIGFAADKAMAEHAVVEL